MSDWRSLVQDTKHSNTRARTARKTPAHPLNRSRAETRGVNSRRLERARPSMARYKYRGRQSSMSGRAPKTSRHTAASKQSPGFRAISLLPLGGPEMPLATQIGPHSSPRSSARACGTSREKPCVCVCVCVCGCVRGTSPLARLSPPMRPPPVIPSLSENAPQPPPIAARRPRAAR